MAGGAGSVARGAAGRGGCGGGLACRCGVASSGVAAKRAVVGGGAGCGGAGVAASSVVAVVATAGSARPGPSSDSGGAADSFQAVTLAAAWNGWCDLSFFATITRARGEPAIARSIDSLVAW